MLLAGDAAHQMPPFAGQGMCAGIRDAANLAWKLDLVLARHVAGRAARHLRAPSAAPNMRAVIELAIELGKVICVADPDEAAARDEALIAADDGSLTDVPPLPGHHRRHRPCRVTARGRAVRARQTSSATARGRGSTTSSAPAGASSPTARSAVDADLADWFAGIGGRSWPSASPGLLDVDGTYGRWFADHGVVAALQRPDFALFGTAPEPSEVDALLRSLQERLAAP